MPLTEKCDLGGLDGRLRSDSYSRCRAQSEVTERAAQLRRRGRDEGAGDVAGGRWVRIMSKGDDLGSSYRARLAEQQPNANFHLRSHDTGPRSCTQLVVDAMWSRRSPTAQGVPSWPPRRGG